MKTILDLFQAMQMMVYVMLFNLQISAVTEMILEEFKKLVEFQLLNPEKLLQQVYDPEFTIKGWIFATKEQIISKDQMVSMLDELIVYIFIVALFLLSLCLLGLAWSCSWAERRDKIKSRLKSIIDNTVFNGLINSLKISLFKYCYAIGNQVRLLVYESEFITAANLTTTWVLTGSLVFVMFVSGRFLWNKYETLS